MLGNTVFFSTRRGQQEAGTVTELVGQDAVRVNFGDGGPAKFCHSDYIYLPSDLTRYWNLLDTIDLGPID